jgi:uncharacterized repeat protein (TIGR01451 family)
LPTPSTSDPSTTRRLRGIRLRGHRLFTGTVQERDNMGMNSHHQQSADRAHSAAAAHRRRSGKRHSAAIYLAMVIAMVGALMLVQSGSPTPVQAASSVLTLNVISARAEAKALGGDGVAKGAPITSFKYIINVDNTGTTEQNPYKAGSPAGCAVGDAGYPDSCHWTSMGAESSAPIYTTGDQNDFAGGAGLTLPDGRYLISVLADGFKLDGVHFTVPLPDTGLVTVELQPTPLPTATIKAQVFEDISPTNSAPDLPIEHGLEGFDGQIADYLGQVITDVFGNPICTHYLEELPNTDPTYTGLGNADYILDQTQLVGPDYSPTPIVGSGGHCLSDANGVLTFPNLGPNRYTLTATPPDGSAWVQTTTLEGNHDWDAWVMEGATGLDTEFTQGGEPFPAIFFGFVAPTAITTPATGHIKGVVDGVHVYVPAKGGTGQTGQIFGGLTGTKIDKPIDKPWIALTALTGTPELDTAIYVGQGNSDGTFDIAGVPDGNYTLSWWDEPQNYIFDLVNVSVANGETVDMGILPLNGWWTTIDGYVFNDDNRNGVRDPGETGVPQFTLTMRKRENSLMDRGTTAVTTDADGYYSFEGAYPMTQWLVEEAYSDSYYTTGVTYQSDNQPDPTTVLGAGVDVSMLPIIGLSGTLDWGVHAYDPTGANGIDPRNGGIVGTVSYDTTRNELDPRYAAVEDWQPGISNLDVGLYKPVPCPVPNTAGVPCSTAAGPKYVLDTDGSYAKGDLVNTYLTETWEQPTGCVARDVDGVPLIHGIDENVLPGDNAVDNTAPCLEGPLMGTQFQTGFSSVDGNYGFGTVCLAPNVLDASDWSAPTCTDPNDTSPEPADQFTPIDAGDYLVSIIVPNDAQGRPQYKVTREEDINIGNGDQFIPQVPPPACAGALHTVDVAGSGPSDNYPAVSPVPGVDVPESEPTDNQTFVDIGGSPYDGQVKPLCDTKLVSLKNGKSIVPTFNYFTDVPLPGRFWGLIVDDLNFSSDPKSLLVGEKAGVPFAPVGVYDYTNKLVYTTESDYNGLWDVLMPSTNRINCPTPSGVCGNLYRFVGNDPGAPGHLNLNYKPNFITIAAEFEALPGLIVPADLAPTQVGVNVQLPGGQFSQVQCALDPVQPQIYRISKPNGAPSNSATYAIDGFGFGATQGTGHLLLDPATGSAAPTDLSIVSWSNTQIVFRVLPGTGVGARNLHITASNGLKTVNGITFHVTGAAYNPNVYEVGPGKTYDPTSTNANGGIHAIQHAIDAAAASPGDRDLVVIYPNLADLVNPRNNPRGAYYENLIVTRPVKIQGVGPGGTNPVTGVTTPGAIIDAGAFAGDSVIATDWYTTLDALPVNGAGTSWDGNQNVFDGAGITIFARSGTFAAANTAGYAPSIDGLDLRGGNQQGFPGNLNAIGGGATGLPANMTTQGGAIFANAYATNLRITNNTVQNNGGAYGTIRIGTPDIPAPDTSNHNENIRISNNRIIQNGGTNLAGAIGLFAGANNYEVANNDICGNFSAEYGGGISAFGYSPNGRIHDNRVYFNASYDEGGGIMVGGTLQADPTALSPGSGPVNIYNNLVQANLSNDDGGGIRFLMAGNFPMNVYNNIVVNNVSTHEGGGIALNDTPSVRVFNNTIMKNITTATAVTSNGTPAPAGLSTSLNSDPLQNSLPVGSPTFSNPLLFNNIFWDNRAGTRAGGSVTGIGALGDATAINNWDLGDADVNGLLSPTNSVMQVSTGTNSSPTNIVGTNPNVVTPYDVGMSFQVWRNNPAFVGAIMATVDLPPNQMGNYHVAAGSPAINAGAAIKSGVPAPAFDIDNGARPSAGGYEIGADEFVVQVANLAISKTDGKTTVQQGASNSYTIVVSNPSAAPVANALVTDNLPANFTGATWTCSGSAGSICPASGSGNISAPVTIGAGGSVVFAVIGTVSPTATGTLTNTATVAAPAGTTDPSLGNNTSTDTTTITPATPAAPVFALLDAFTRANANTLAPNWGQTTFAGFAALRVNSNQAFALISGQAMWNSSSATFGSKQGAQLTFATNTLSNTALILKATGGSAAAPQRFVRVQYQTNGGGRIVVSTTTNSGGNYTQRGTNLAVSFANGDKLGAVVDSTGLVSIYKTTGATTTLVGTRQLPTSGGSTFPGGGRIGMQVPTNGRIDNFSGGTLA